MSAPVAAPAAAAVAGPGGWLEIDARLVEEAVLLASRTAAPAEQRRFRSQRDPLYEIADPEAREALFRALHGRWFGRWRLAEPLLEVLGEQPALERSTCRCHVAPAPSAKAEYADLHGGQRGFTAGAGRPALVIRLRPATLVAERRLVAFLRRELLHVADLLDPEFGFHLELAVAGEPALASLVRERYRVLWKTSVDGRLAAAGRLEPGGEERSRSRFLAAFPMLGEAAESTFRRLFSPPRPSHRELLAFAADPPVDASSGGGARPCPLCRMPAAALHPRPGSLAPEVVATIRAALPEWRTEAGLCRQCADLFAARAGAGENSRPPPPAATPPRA